MQGGRQGGGVRRAVGRAGEDWMGAQCGEIEACLIGGNSKRACRLVGGLTSGRQGGSSTIQDKSGKCLTEEGEILSGWTEYCSELCSYESCGDNAVLDCGRPPEEGLRPILRGKVGIAVASLKWGRSAGVDDVPAELVQAGGETVMGVLAGICGRVWRTGGWPAPWTQSLIITLPREGGLRLCQGCRTIGLVGRSGKVVLKVIFGGLKPQTEEIIAEEQAGFRAGGAPRSRSSASESCVKSTSGTGGVCTISSSVSGGGGGFDGVWHAALWAAMRGCGVGAELVRTIEQLYDRAAGAVQMGGSVGEWFGAAVGVGRGCPLSPALFGIFLERVVCGALGEYGGRVGVGGGVLPICGLPMT